MATQDITHVLLDDIFAGSFPQVRRSIDQGKSAQQIRAELLKRVSQAYAARGAIRPGKVRP
jgi:hypothetical protein